MDNLFVVSCGKRSKDVPRPTNNVERVRVRDGRAGEREGKSGTERERERERKMMMKMATY